MNRNRFFHRYLLSAWAVLIVLFSVILTSCTAGKDNQGQGSNQPQPSAPAASTPTAAFAASNAPEAVPPLAAASPFKEPTEAYASAAILTSPVATIHVSDDKELAEALAGAKPGTLIVLADGNYAGGDIQTQGTEANPIELRAANQGKAVFNSGMVHLKGAKYTVLNGLTFTNGGAAAQIDGQKLAAAVLIEGDYNRITRSTLQIHGSSSKTEWVLIAGGSNHNRIDYSEFGPNTKGGHYIMALGYSTIPGVTNPKDRTAWADYGSPFNPNMPRYTQIDHNYFHDNTGSETMCLGCAGMAGDYQETFMLVEHNLFVNCDGDAEIITIKSSNNTVRYNTIRTSKGMLSSRAGNQNSIYGNFMLQGNKPGTGGIKVYEKDQRVYNNYIDGASEYPILFGGGDAYTDPKFAHAQVFRAIVVNNTIVGANNRPIIIGHGSNLPPVDSVFANNIVVGSASALLDKRLPSNTAFVHNIVHGNLGATAKDEEFRKADPMLTTVDGLLKLTAGSPAIDYAAAGYSPFVQTDMDGQTRAKPDAGADEYSTDKVVLRPLTPDDAGPKAAPVGQ